MPYSIFSLMLVPNSDLLFWELGLPVPAWCIRDISVFSVALSVKTDLSRFISAANVCRDTDVFGS